MLKKRERERDHRSWKREEADEMWLLFNLKRVVWWGSNQKR